MKILTKVMDLLALSVILSFMILMFSGCQMASGTLSEKEITVFNTEFFNGDITNMNNMLLSSEYSQPDEINLFENFDWCMVTSGTWESNNKLILKYEKEYEGGQWVVILQKTDDGYLFISNQKAD